MKNLIECIKINMTIERPALRVTTDRIREVLDNNGICTGTDFGSYYNYKKPLEAFAKDYLNYACSKGFKSK